MAFFPPDFSIDTSPSNGGGGVANFSSDEPLIDPSDVVLEQCSLVTLDCQIVDLKFVLMELNIYEDLFANHVSGNIVINDSNNLIANLGLYGYEMIFIRFCKPGTKEAYEKHFRLYKIGDRSTNTLSNENYIMYFCSEERLLTEQTIVSKCYDFSKASDIVSDICGNQLRIPPTRIDIEASKHNYNLIVPMKKPIDAIQWAATYTPDHVFYENRDGYHFRSIETLWKKEPKRTYIYGPKNVQSQKDFHVTEIGVELSNIISYRFRHNFDVLSSMGNGMYASHLVTIDPLRGRIASYAYEYGKDQGNNGKLNPNNNKKIATGQSGYETDPEYNPAGTSFSSYPDEVNDGGSSDTKGFPMVAPSQKNRLGFEIYKSYGPDTMVCVTTKNHDVDSDITKRDPTIRPNNVEQTVMQRNGRISRLRHTVLEIVIPGDPGLLIGDTCIINLPSVQPQFSGKPIQDEMYSGKYLVTAVRHNIQKANYSTTVELGRYAQNTPMPNGNCDVLDQLYKG